MRILLLLISVFCCSSYYGQTINAELLELNFAGGSYPKDLTFINNKVFFSAYTDRYGRELWVHDELTGETYMVKNIRNWGDSSIDDYAYFTSVNEILYFVSTDGFGSLWRSDGTEEGTYMVKDIFPDSTDSYMRNLTAFNGKLYFIANDGIHGEELWVSDGTESGTILLKDINPGTPGSDISKIYVFNNTLYFSARSQGYGRELWKSDGTQSGTELLKDINPGNGWGTMSNITVFDNNIYFLADNGSGSALWKSNGTSEGTVLFKTFSGGGAGSDMESINLDDKFIFYLAASGQYQLWKSDGSLAGTTVLKQINSQDNFNSFSQFVKLNNVIYFTAGDSFYGYEQIWKTNGTVSGTQQIIDLNMSIYAFAASNSYLIFGARDIDNNNKVFVSNGSASGTTQLNDLDLYTTSAGEVKFYTSGNATYFPARDGIKGTELWKTQGTAESTELIKDINHVGSGLTTGGAKATSVLNDKLIFLGTEGNVFNPFISDATSQGTHIISPQYPQNESHAYWDEYVLIDKAFTLAGNKLFYRGHKMGMGYEIYCTNGTEEGSRMVKDIFPGNNSSISQYAYFMEYNGIFYFKANDQIHGDELWRSDGSEAGTYMLKDINAGPSSGVQASNYSTFQNQNYAVLNGFLYFLATDATGTAIWRTDGTEAGTIKVIATENDPIILGANDTKLFYATNHTGSSWGVNTLWSSDGTPEGTLLIETYNQGSATQFREACIHNNELYYSVMRSGSGLSIMKSDGSIEGTLLIKGQLQGIFYDIRYLKSCGDYVYFVVGDRHGVETGNKLWRTDGTPEGTFQINDSGNMQGLTAFTCQNNELLYLNIVETARLYVVKNTYPLINLPIDITVSGNPEFGNYSRISSILAVINDKIYFEGTTLEGGGELYVANANGLLGIDDDTDVKDVNHRNVIVYPNPANGSFKIHTTDNAVINSIELYDLTGKKVLSKMVVDSEYNADISELSRGIYLLRINTNTSVITKKIIRN